MTSKPNVRGLTDEQWDDVLAELYSQNGWYRVPNTAHYLLDPVQSIIFSKLINIRQMAKHSDKKDRRNGVPRRLWRVREDNSFHVKAGRLEKAFSISSRTVDRALAEMKKLKIISTQIVGNQRKRYVIVHLARYLVAIEMAKDKALSKYREKLDAKEQLRKKKRMEYLEGLLVEEAIPSNCRKAKSHIDGMNRKKTLRLTRARSLERTISKTKRAVKPSEFDDSPGFGLIKETDADVENLHRAKKLRTAVKATGRAFGWSEKKWTMEMRRLVNKDKVPSSRVDAVLDWYCANCTSVKDPKIINARHFRSCFQWLSDLQTKHARENITISKAAEKVYSFVKNESWPKGSRDKLKQAIQLTLNNYAVFWRGVNRWGHKYVGKSRKEEAIYHYFVSHFSDAVQFTINWFKNVSRRVEGWEDWSGNVIGTALKEDLTKDEKFNQKGVSAFKSWDSSPEFWPTLLDRVLKMGAKE